MKEENQKIARKAAELWFVGEDALGKPRVDQAALTDIILAAIEEANNFAALEESTIAPLPSGGGDETR